MNTIFHILVEISITSSILILTILVLRRLFKNRISAAIQYAIWLVVVIRLLTPFNIPSAASVMNVFHFDRQQTTVAQMTDTDSVINPDEGDITIASNINRESPEGSNKTPADMTTADRNKLDPIMILLMVWATGIFFTVAYMIVINVKYWKRINKSSKEFPKEYEQLLAKTHTELNIQKNIPVLVSDEILSPCLLGWLHPRIIMTSKALENDRTIRYVLIHELCHYKQRDNWTALLRNICCAVYWFHPLVWVGAVVSREDAELACDEKVLNYLNKDENINYGETLLHIVREHKYQMSVVHTSTSMTLGGKKMSERIDRIMKRPKTLKSVIVCIAVVLLVAVGVTYSSAVPMTGDSTTNDILVDKNKVEEIIKNLPEPSVFHKQNMFSLEAEETSCKLTVYYESNEYEGDEVPFWYSGMENNALTLFIEIDNLSQVTFAYRDTPSNGELVESEYVGIYEYARTDFIKKFGDLAILKTDTEKLMQVLSENLRIDDYKVHTNRISFESPYDHIIYREGSEPDKIIRNDDDSYEMIYINLGEAYSYGADGQLIGMDDGQDVTFYLDKYGIEGVYAAYIKDGNSEIIYRLGLGEGLTYTEITKKLGQPQLTADNDKVISYLLYGYDDRYVTFAFDEEGNLKGHGFNIGDYNPFLEMD